MRDFDTTPEPSGEEAPPADNRFVVQRHRASPVSASITWDDFDDPDLVSDRWTIETVPERIATAGDPLATPDRLAYPLPRV